MNPSVVTVPLLPTLEEPWRTHVNITASEVRDVLTSSALYCTWEVTRGGEIEPCMKAAVAIRYDESNGGLGVVCKAHACRVLVPLEFIAYVAGANR